MTIQHKESNSHGMFFIETDGDVIAQIVYSKNGGNTLVIEHTEVKKSLRGKNIGYELVHRTVEYARMHRLRVSPLCPFAKAVFDKQADWQSLLV